MVDMIATSSTWFKVNADSVRGILHRLSDFELAQEALSVQWFYECFNVVDEVPVMIEIADILRAHIDEEIRRRFCAFAYEQQGHGLSVLQLNLLSVMDD